MSISVRRLAANRLNALRSTGPRTAEGKAASRRNALKHGLTGAGAVLPISLEAAVAAKAKEYEESHEPRTAYERDVVRRLALATVRGQLITGVESARQTKRVRETIAKLDSQHAETLRAAGALIRAGSADAASLERLRSFTEGCDWLADAWDELETNLNERGIWRFSDALLLAGLLAIGPVSNAASDADAIEVWRVALAVCDPDSPGVAAAIESLRNGASAELLDFESAKATIIETIAQTRAEYEALGDEHWTKRDQADRELEIALVVVDQSPEGRLLTAYRAATDREFHKNAAELHKHRDSNRPQKTNPPRELTLEVAPNHGVSIQEPVIAVTSDTKNEPNDMSEIETGSDVAITDSALGRGMASEPCDGLLDQSGVERELSAAIEPELYAAGAV